MEVKLKGSPRRLLVGFSIEIDQERIGWYTQNVERKKKKLSTRNSIPGKAVQKCTRDKEFPEQTKTEGVHHH